jgi:hypothetical protein
MILSYDAFNSCTVLSCTFFIFSILTIEQETIIMFQNVGHYHPVTEHHISEEWRPHMHCCASLKTQLCGINYIDPLPSAAVMVV